MSDPIKRLKLYFQHSDGSVDYVCDVENGLYVSAALKDLYERNPKYQSYYQRTWKDDNGWIWIDVGSWSEFYIIKEESDEKD